jgi:hypothetical protein
VGWHGYSDCDEPANIKKRVNARGIELDLYAYGQTDKLPDWAVALKIKQMLWLKYGVSVGIEVDEMYDAIMLNVAENQREGLKHG